jgi:ribosome recycling factor
MLRVQVQKLHDEFVNDIEQLRKRKEADIEASHHL